MNPMEFDSAFRRLERLYVKDQGALPEELRGEYFATVRDFAPFLFEKAIDLIRDTHKMKAMPTPAEIREAVEEVIRHTPRATAQDLAEICPNCENDGWYFVPAEKSAGIARYCSCPVGRRKRELHVQRGMGKKGPVTIDRQRRHGGEPEPVGNIVKRERSFYEREDDEVPF